MLSKEEKAFCRKKILSIIGDHSVSDLTDDELKQVQKLSELLSSTVVEDSNPLPTIDFETFTWEEYLRLKEKGYKVSTIKKSLGIGNGKWLDWRKQNQKIQQDKMEVGLDKKVVIKIRGSE